MRVVPVFSFYPVYSNTVQNVYLHGFKDDEGIAFVTIASANLPGRPPAVSLELGAVAAHFVGPSPAASP